MALAFSLAAPRAATPGASAARSLARPWACPGLYHITPARDGGLCRLRLPAGRLALSEALTIVAAAETCGAPIIEITNRANLQLRGIAAGQEAVLAAALGGSTVAADPAHERMRNIAASPTAGLDPGELVDIGPIVEALWRRLPDHPRAASLSAKFGILLDGGGRPSPYAGRPFDIVLSAVVGSPLLALGWDEPAPLSGARLAVPPERAVETVLAAISLLTELGGNRAFATIREIGRARFEKLLQARFDRPLDRIVLPAGTTDRPTSLLGFFPQRQPGLAFVGARPPLGRMTPGQLAAIINATTKAGGRGLRLTPSRSILATGVPAAMADGLLATFADLGLLTEDAQPLTRIVACAGSTGCAHGLTDTQVHARRLAKAIGVGALPAGADIHLSGCAKGCAHPLPARLVLVATSPRHYSINGEAELPESRALADAALLATGDDWL